MSSLLTLRIGSGLPRLRHVTITHSGPSPVLPQTAARRPGSGCCLEALEAQRQPVAVRSITVPRGQVH